MMVRSTMAAAAVLALAACGGGAETGGNAEGATPIAAPAGSSWVETTSESEAGGFVMGNPGAPVKLIEYGALSCGVCGRFSEDSAGPLRGYIEKGTVSYEFRPFPLNALDIPTFLLARCSGPGPFFPIAEQLFAAQQQWLGVAQTIPPAELERIQTMSAEQAAPLLAERLDLITFVQQRGIGAQQAQACLTDKAAADRLMAIREAGSRQFEVNGTPTFIVNGRRADGIVSWSQLEPELKAAGA